MYTNKEQGKEPEGRRSLINNPMLANFKTKYGAEFDTNPRINTRILKSSRKEVANKKNKDSDGKSPYLIKNAFLKTNRAHLTGYHRPTRSQAAHLKDGFSINLFKSPEKSTATNFGIDSVKPSPESTKNKNERKLRCNLSVPSLRTPGAMSNASIGKVIPFLIVHYRQKSG